MGMPQVQARKSQQLFALARLRLFFTPATSCSFAKWTSVSILLQDQTAFAHFAGGSAAKEAVNQHVHISICSYAHASAHIYVTIYKLTGQRHSHTYCRFPEDVDFDRRLEWAHH